MLKATKLPQKNFSKPLIWKLEKPRKLKNGKLRYYIRIIRQHRSVYEPDTFFSSSGIGITSEGFPEFNSHSRTIFLRGADHFRDNMRLKIPEHELDNVLSSLKEYIIYLAQLELISDSNSST